MGENFYDLVKEAQKSAEEKEKERAATHKTSPTENSSKTITLMDESRVKPILDTNQPRQYAGSIGGIISIIIGVLWLLYALIMDTSVETPTGRVHNFSLASTQKTYVILSCFLILLGVVLHILKRVKGNQHDTSDAAPAQGLSTNTKWVLVWIGWSVIGLLGLFCFVLIINLIFK